MGIKPYDIPRPETHYTYRIHPRRSDNPLGFKNQRGDTVILESGDVVHVVNPVDRVITRHVIGKSTPPGLIPLSGSEMVGLATYFDT